jgi:CheY-like chemotaxis protein
MIIAKTSAEAPDVLAESGETLRQEWLRTISQRASSIAHDIDVAIAPVALHSAALLETETLSERARNHLVSIRRAVDDVTRTAARLRELDALREPTRPLEDMRRPPMKSSPSRSLRVLLIDDDPSLVESLRSSLADEGHKVMAANGGRAGIEAFRQAQRAGMMFDIVITDLAMPDVDGREVVTSLRALSPLTPIVLLTGWQHHLADAGQLPLQVDRLLGKPPRIRELRAALAELTERRTTGRVG